MSCTTKKQSCSIKSLTDLVKCYQKCYQKEKNNELNYFKSMEFEQVLEKAAYALGQDGGKFSHQKRLTKETSKNVLSVLKDIKTEINDVKNFEQLYDLLEKKLLPIHGVGDLFIFDTALRIGAKLHFQPTQLFVQSGSKDGAKELGLDVNNKRVSLNQLPTIITQQLEPYEIENFLCIYRKAFYNLKNS